MIGIMSTTRTTIVTPSVALLNPTAGASPRKQRLAHPLDPPLTHPFDLLLLIPILTLVIHHSPLLVTLSTTNTPSPLAAPTYLTGPAVTIYVTQSIYFASDAPLFRSLYTAAVYSVLLGQNTVNTVSITNVSPISGGRRLAVGARGVAEMVAHVLSSIWGGADRDTGNDSGSDSGSSISGNGSGGISSSATSPLPRLLQAVAPANGPGVIVSYTLTSQWPGATPASLAATLQVVNAP